MEGGGLIAHPTVWQIVITIVLVIAVVFLMAAGSQIVEIFKKAFSRKARA